MKQLPGTLLAALALLAAIALARECGYRDGARTAVARAQDVRLDSLRAEMAYRESVAEQQFRRGRDSLQRENARLRAKIAPRDSIVLTDTVVVYRELAGRDSLIQSLDSALAHATREALFWQTEVGVYRDSVIPSLAQSRDAWREMARAPRHTLTDWGGAALLGYGVAEESNTIVVAGLAVVILPRVIRGIAQIF